MQHIGRRLDNEVWRADWHCVMLRRLGLQFVTRLTRGACVLTQTSGADLRYDLEVDDAEGVADALADGVPARLLVPAFPESRRTLITDSSQRLN